MSSCTKQSQTCLYLIFYNQLDSLIYLSFAKKTLFVEYLNDDNVRLFI